MKKVTKVLYKCGCSTKIELKSDRYDASRHLICPNCGTDYSQMVGRFMNDVLEVNAAIEKFSSIEKDFPMLEVIE